MKTVHTIQINDGKGGTTTATRTSESRAYAACVVSTVTQRVVDIYEEGLVKAAAKLAESTALLAERKVRLGLDEEAAKVAQAQVQRRWFSDEGLRSLPRAVQLDDKAARAALEGRGFAYPWDKDGPFGILDAAEEIQWCTRRLADPAPVVGAQGVESWHGTVCLAATAADRLRTTVTVKTGHTFEVRTDVTRVERGSWRAA